MILFLIYFYLLFKFLILEGFGKLKFGYLGFRYILVSEFHNPFYFYDKFEDFGFG